VSPLAEKQIARNKRKVRVRKKVLGTADRPRLNVFKSSRHIYAQLIDDTKGVTLASASTLLEGIVQGEDATGNIAAAKSVGAAIARNALAINITSVVFDRNGFLYHGRVSALADSARENGLSF
jgi:large subunit ribosomal protein L18